MPRRAQQRRSVQSAQGKYDAAGTGRRIASWNPPSTGPNRATVGLQKIRNRARDSSRNDWAGAASVQKWTTALIGVGVTPRWKDKALSTLWASHVADADADCVLDAYGMQALAVRSWFDSGEVFLRRRPRKLSLGLPAPVQFQLIESDFVPLLDASTWPGMPTGNTIRQGIELNNFGQRIAYWMYREHPGDGAIGSSIDPTSLVRVPASDVSHVFEPTRPGQLRGVSGLSSVLVRLRASMDYEDAVLDRQKLANLFVAFVTRQMPDDADVDYDPETGLPKFYDQTGNPLVGLEPGVMQTMQPGEGVTFANPPEAGTTYSDYLRTTHMGTAAGSGLPYEVLSGDIRNVGDRVLRVIIQEFRRFARQRQWHLVIPMICQPMVEWWADALVLTGDLTLADLPAAKAPKWTPEGWEYIHPTQDAQGKQIMIDAGIVSRDDVISERGDDPAEVDASRKEAADRAEKMGLSPVAIVPAPTPAPPPAGAPAPAPKPAPKALETFVASLMPLIARADHGVLIKALADIAGAISNAHNPQAPAPVALDVTQSSEV